MNRSLKHRRLFAALAGVAFAGAVCAPAIASDVASARHGCERKFEEAQRIDMESFRDYDAQTFREGHVDDAITIFGSGFVAVGIDDIMAALSGHFEDQEAIWEWTELYRTVQKCRTAFILYETTYTIPSSGFVAHALTGVTYTYTRGKWLAVADQGTPLPLEEE